jgi:hypothetical protein
MQVPAVMFIEMAADRLTSETQQTNLVKWVRTHQMTELESFGDERAKKLGASGISNDFARGYELGLETARVVITGNVDIRLKSINPDNVL